MLLLPVLAEPLERRLAALDVHILEILASVFPLHGAHSMHAIVHQPILLPDLGRRLRHALLTREPRQRRHPRQTQERHGGGETVPDVGQREFVLDGGQSELGRLERLPRQCEAVA
jgi:hypothetical protein